MNRTYQRGDLYYADLGRGIGSEQEGYRPVVIIQNNMGNKHSPTVIIAAITGKVGAKAKLPTHYVLPAENGLETPSIVLLEQIRTIDKRRLEGRIGRLPEKHIFQVLTGHWQSASDLAGFLTHREALMVDMVKTEEFTYQVDKIKFIVTPVYKEDGETMRDILLKLMLSELESA